MIVKTYAEKLTLVRLSDQYIADTVSLCDRCAGDHLYPREHLEQALTSPNCHYFLLLNGEKVASYLFLKSLDTHELAKELRIKTDIGGGPAVRFYAIGVREDLRNNGISRWLMDFAITYSKEILKAEYMAGAFWKQGDCVPMKSVLDDFAFEYITEIKSFWWNVDALYCPVCRGRCFCTAEIYGRKLQ